MYQKTEESQEKIMRALPVDMNQTMEARSMVGNLLHEFVTTVLDELIFIKKDKELVSDKHQSSTKCGIFIQETPNQTQANTTSLLTKNSTVSPFKPRRSKFYLEPLLSYDPNYYSIQVSSIQSPTYI